MAMNVRRLARSWVVPVCAVLFGIVLARHAVAQDKVLFDFQPPFDVASVTKVDTTVRLSGAAAAGIEATFGIQSSRPMMTLKSTGWDLSGFVHVAMDVTNLGTDAIGVHADVSVQGRYPYNESVAWVEPGETETLSIVLYRSTLPSYVGNYLKGMNGLPGGYVWHWEILDLARVDTLRIWQLAAVLPHSVRISNVRATGAYALPTEQQLTSGFFPLVDEFGQYAKASWPGKATSQSAIDAQRDAEKADLRDHAGPNGWDTYGGYLTGPVLQATGHFRVEKAQDKWWLVDPDGHVFWSFGLDCVGSWQSTPTVGRETYFTTIPDSGDFRAANLRRKFGQDWATWSAAANDLAHTRLRSWGMNTIANWSDASVYRLGKTPYVVSLGSGIAKAVPATLNATQFAATVAAQITADAVKDTANDPMCIGYFVDNELDWASSSEAVANTYYQVVRARLKAVAPNKLYLGSRIHTAAEGIYRAAAANCDVVGINRYAFTASDFALPSGVDKPVIIGEFHFGALDRGLPHTGLRSVGSQKQRARAFADYVRQALAHPQIVGAHWFQLSDQVYTGRSDGENYQIGFVDIVDRPYPEMVDASRTIGSGLYEYRTIGKPFASPADAGGDASGVDAAVPADGAGGGTSNGGAGGQAAGFGGSTSNGGAGGQGAAAGGSAGGGGAPAAGGTGGSENGARSVDGAAGSCACRAAKKRSGSAFALIALGCFLAARRRNGRRPAADSG
jgi:hypothetical protein